MGREGLRRGGRARLPSDEQIVWSIADGRRGRRWREVSSVAETVIRAVLLETDPSGRLTRLEMGTAAGLLTLHPDAGQSVLHGNVVTSTGIRHLSFDRTAVLVDASPASAAILLGGLTDVVTVGATARVDLVRVDDRLEPRIGSWVVSRIELLAWRLVELSEVDGGGGAGAEAVNEVLDMRLDDDGLPSGLGGDAWPLEA